MVLDSGLSAVMKWGGDRMDKLKILVIDDAPEVQELLRAVLTLKDFFVVDAYTKRIFSRQKLLSEEADYHQVQELFTRSLKKDVQLYNEYHALIVRLGKDFCKKTNPKCEICPIR